MPGGAPETGSRGQALNRDTVRRVTDDDIVEQRIVDDVVGDMERYVDEHSPDRIHLPDSVSDEEAVLAIQHEHQQAGFECLEEQAREMVLEARSHD
jgi:hypothetical protein